MEAKKFLQSVGAEVQGAFVQGRTLLSFEEYLDGFFQAPRTHARNAAQYLVDCFDHYGRDEVVTPVGKVPRWRLFDAPFADGRGKVCGLESVQAAVYRTLSSFVRMGRANKVILLHGPNGSAKTTFVQLLAAALEDYSRTDAGAVYRYYWVLPSERFLKGSIGFAEGHAAAEHLPSYAHLEGEQIDARIACELKDHPLLLVPRAERGALLRKHCHGTDAEHAGPGDDFVLSDALLHGEICHKCRAIHDALLAHYNGDYLRVLRHVQVERFTLSSRYLTGIVTVEPQLSVDADFRQVTVDRSHGQLPAALADVVLYQPHGALVRGNRGIVEYSDLLKRPLEAFKYLLGCTESGRVPLEPFLLHLDAVLLASSNEKHLAAFKEMPDFASFKGRIELVRVPYLRRWSVEKEIYDQRVTRQAVGRHVAPHVTEVAALWAVLTRLKKPLPERYESALRAVVDDLSPLEKLRLYDRGEPPDHLPLAQARELKKVLPDLFRESEAYPNYEGRMGASAREVQTALFHAAQRPEARCLTPLAVLEELQALCSDKSVYEFLQQEVVDGYHDHEEFVRVAEDVWLDIVDAEIREAMGILSDAQVQELFGRYVVHVSHWVRGEKIENRATGAYERPDEDMMAGIEDVVMTGDRDRRDFRKGLIGSIGAHRLENPGAEPIAYTAVFPDLFRRLKDHFFDQRKRALHRGVELALRWLDPGERAHLEPRDAERSREALDTLRGRYGYCDECARAALVSLMRQRYADGVP